MTISDKIQETLRIQDILQKYNYKTNHHNRIPCMMHRGKDNNFCYTDKVFHCWVCGESGNVISLVMKLFNLDFKSAVIKINYDFNLNFTNEKPTYRDRIKSIEIQRQRELEKQKQKEADKLYLDVVTYRQKLWSEGKPVDFIDRVLDNEPEIIKYLDLGKEDL